MASEEQLQEINVGFKSLYENHAFPLNIERTIFISFCNIVSTGGIPKTIDFSSILVYRTIPW